MNIWLLEDDPAQAELLSHWLVEAGHIVTHYATGAAIMGELGRGGFDLLILDWELPDTSGIEVLADVRATCPGTCPCCLSPSAMRKPTSSAPCPTERTTTW